MRHKLALYDLSFTMIIVVMVASLIGIVAQRYLGEDNFAEEAAEEVIESHVGINLDFSPGDDPELR